MHLGKLLFQGINLLLHGRNVDFGLLFEGVHIARNVEVVVVIFNRLFRNKRSKMRNVLSVQNSVNYLFDMMTGQAVFVAVLKELLLSVNN